MCPAQSSMFARESFTQQLHYPNGVIQEQFALFPQLIGQKNQEKINWLYSKEDLSLTLLEKRDIHLDINTFLKVIGYYLKVEELYLNGVSFVGWIDWTQFPENLRVLELTDSNLLFFMGSFGALPRNLEKLSLKGCKNLHFCDWSALPPKLKSLDISGVNVNNPVVYADELPKSLTQLKITMDPLQHFEQKQALTSGKWTACEDGDDIVFEKNWIWKEEPAVEKTTEAPEFANVA